MAYGHVCIENNSKPLLSIELIGIVGAVLAQTYDHGLATQKKNVER